MINNSNLFETLILNLTQPDAILNALAAYIKKQNLTYDNAKVFAKYVEGSNRVVVSLTNQTWFQDVTFPQSEHFIVLALRVLSGANATLAASAWLPGVADALTINGSISLTNNGVVFLKNLPLTVFPLSTNNADIEAGFFILEKPILWQAQTSLSILATWATAPSTANQNLRFELWGYKLI
ncbi:MAG: hypothetical protein NW207_04785 [Cytophagales bacterium]|nr:hypothetical protein [Cytophagales bacterium]